MMQPTVVHAALEQLQDVAVQAGLAPIEVIEAVGQLHRRAIISRYYKDTDRVYNRF